ncbi:ComEC/Rec2-related protein [Pseudonocardia sp. N23]|nr:ComEC/Rec2-related protein [Pseudonocardia sp. N23]
MRDSVDEETAVPPDLRLVPAALVVWAVTVTGLLGGVVGVVVVAGLLLAAAGVLARRARGRRWGAGAVGALGCAVAALVVTGANVAFLAGHPLAAAVSTGASATLRATLTDDPRPVRPAVGVPVAGARQVTISAALEEAAVGAGTWTTGGRVLLIAPAEGWSGLLPGQSVRAEGLLAPPTRSDLTVAVLRVRGTPAEVTAPPWWQRAAGTLRDGLRTASGVLPDRSAGLLPGLTVGDTRDQSPEVADDFRAAGLTHLTAVSGANLAVVAGAVLLLLRLLRAGPRACAVGAGLALVGFVVLARPSPSVLRAAVMGGVVLLALAVGRRRSAVPALAATVTALLLWDPRLAVDPGFALSAAATAALVLVAPGWVRRLRERGFPSGVAEALVVPAAAGIATAPLIAGLSGTVSLVSLSANLLAAPVVAPATVLGVLAALLSVVSPVAAQACAWLAGPEVAWLVLVADRAAAVQGGVVPWPSGWVGALLLVVVIVVLAVLVRSRRLRALLVAVLVGLLLVLVPTRVVTPGWPPTGWAVVTCDVGQGDALVLATGSPGHAVLVDAGPDDGPVDACLARLGVHSLDLVVVSHLHADHIGGMSGALRGRAVGAIAVGPSRQPGAALRRLAVQAREAGTTVVALGPGQRLAWPGLVLDVLGPIHPAADVDPGDGTAVNDGSLVVRAGTRAGSVLLTGDVEIAAQADLLAARVPLRADVLKMPHHGSRYSLREFLAAVSPRVALVSVGAGNSYRHPDPGLLDVLSAAGVAVRRTDHDGDTAVVAAPDGAPGDDGPSLVSRGDPLPGRRRRGRPGRCRRRSPRGSGTRRTSSSAAGGECFANGLAGGRHGGGRGDAVGDGVERLEAVAGDEQDGLGVGVDLAGLDELLRGGDGDPTRGLGEHTLGAGEQLDSVAHLVVGDVPDRPAGAAHRVQDVRAVGRVADRQRAGDRVRLHGPDDVVALLERRRHGGAAGRLRTEHLVRGGLDEAELAELGEALVDLGQL